MKLPYTATCDVDVADELRVDAGIDGEVAVYALHNGSIAGSVFITRKKARKLARALFKAADEAEANEW